MSETITEKKHKLECGPDNARLLWSWIKNRGGVAKWSSINLSNPSGSWITPTLDKEGKPYGKPTWQAANDPEIVTDPEDIGVYQAKLYKAFNVAVRWAGLGTKLTDASQRKLDACLEKCKEEHRDSFYKRGVLAEGVNEDRPSMGVFYTESIIPLSQWIKANGEGKPED